MKAMAFERLLALVLALALLCCAAGVAEEAWDEEAPREVLAAAADAPVDEVWQVDLPEEEGELAIEEALPDVVHIEGDEPAEEEPLPLPPRLAVAELTLGVKEKYALKLQDDIDPVEAGAKFTSSKSKIVAVDEDTGLLTAKRTGKAVITLEVDGTRGTCAVTVVKAPTKVTLSDSKLTLGVEESHALTAKLPGGTASAITYTSSNKKVATVDGQGRVTGVKKGTATITAKTFNGKKAACKVTVKAAPKSVSVNPGVLSLWEGETYTLKPQLSKNSAGSYVVETSDEGVVSVKGCVLTAVKAGSAGVTVTTYNGKTAQIAVEVSRRPVYRALLVGECDFPGTNMRSLPADKDVSLMQKMLSSVRGAADGAWKITTRTNRTSKQIYVDILSTFDGAKEGDVSLFYISAHGDQELTIDGKFPEYAGCLQVYPDFDYSNWYDRNGLTLVTLAEWLSEVPGQVIVIIDSCGSGAAVYNSKAMGPVFSPEEFGNAVVEAFQDVDRAVMAPGLEQGAFVVRNKFYVLTSSAYLGAGWSNGNKYSFFTKWLTDGVATKGSMPADANKDKKATLDELFKYVSKRADSKTFVYEGVKYKQHAQVYPADSTFELFYRP